MKKKRLIILLSFLIPIFILTGLALWIVTTDHVITPAYDENHTLAQYFVEETNTSYDGNEKTPNFKDGVYTNDEDKENFLNTVDFYYKTKGTIGAYSEGLPTNAGTYSVKILEILDSNDNSDNQEGALYVTINISTVNPTLATAVSVSYANQTDGTTRSNYFVTTQNTSDITYTGSFKGVDGNTLEGTIKYSDPTYFSLQIGNDIEYAYTFTPSNSNYNTYSGKCKINTYATVKYFINSTTAPSKLLEVAKNTTLSQESDPSRSGFVFQGWYTNSSYTSIMDFSVPVTTDINIYAKWQEESFSISYNLNGGTVSGSNPTSYTYSSSTITLINPTKDGYDFLGWTGTGLSGKTMTVKINKGSSGDRTYTANWGIKLKLGIQSYNYVAGAENRQWNSFKTNFIPNLVKDSFEDVLGNKIPLKVNENFSIISMTDGVNSYDSSNTSSYLIGSTYLVKVQLTTTTAETYSLYDIETDSYGSVGSFILKYKTAIVNGSYYTIEDAILTTSGNITLAGDNTANLYVSTAFTSLDSNQGNPYNSQDIYNISGRTLLVPFTNSNEEKTITNNSYNSNVYSVLTLPETKTLNFKSSGTLSIGAFMTNSVPNLSVTNQRGVLMNNGTINFENGSYLNSYGYLKGLGTVNLYNGSVATDVMRVYDWPGGNAASNIYTKTFPLNSWSLHNISCNQYYYGGSTLKGFVYVSMSIPLLGERHCTETVTIIGPSNESKCMFMPNENTNDNYILKSSMNSIKNSTDVNLGLVTGSNQINGQKDRILMHGNYIDQSISISLSMGVTVKLETSTSKSLPISFLDIELDRGTNLTLSSSDYLFLPGTNVKINEEAVLIIGDNVDISFMESSKLSEESIKSGDRIFTSFSKDYEYDAYCTNNGTINVSGSIGGKIKTETTGALIDISSGAVSTTYNMLYQTADPRYFSGTVSATGKIKDFSNDYFVQGYFSSINENSTYLWKQETNLKFIKFNFYDDDGTTILGSKTKALLGNETDYTFLGNEYNPRKTYYDFNEWKVSKNGESAVNKVYSNNGNAGSTITYDLFASWTEHQYYFIYYSGYGVEDDGSIIYVDQNDVSYTNKAEYVTKSMLENSVVTLPSASYSVNGVSKYFNGWFAGVDKSTGTTISSFTLSMLQKFVTEYGDGNNIPLYCEFTDSVMLKVTYVANHPDSNKTLSYPEGEVLQGESLDHPDVNQFDNVITERYYFDGWYTQPNGQGDKYADDTIINNNITLYGNWIEKNSITYSTGTQLNIDLGLYSSFSSRTYYYIPGAAHSLLLDEVASETGHKFVGWTISRKTDGSVDYYNNATDLSTSTFSVKDMTLYASYIINKNPLNIVMDANTTKVVVAGQTLTDDGTIEVYYGTNIKSPTITHSEGYREKSTAFTKTSDGSAEPLINDSYMPDCEVTLTCTSEKEPTCITAGTLITLADGTTKKVEDLIIGDMLIVFNHEEGKYDISPMMFNAHSQMSWGEYEVIKLLFSDGTTLKIINEHTLFDTTSNKYVVVNKENVSEYINHNFYSMNVQNGDHYREDVQLVSFKIETEFTGIYNPLTYYHMNCFTEGLLSMPGEIRNLINIFEYDYDLKYKQDYFNKQVEKYGLFTYDEVSQYFSEKIFNALPLSYCKVAIGKGMTTWEEIYELISKYDKDIDDFD